MRPWWRRRTPPPVLTTWERRERLDDALVYVTAVDVADDEVVLVDRDFLERLLRDLGYEVVPPSS